MNLLPDSIKHKNLVAKATSDDETPTAGFVQEELKKLTHDPSACGTVEDALLSRLEKRSANVRLKTLRVIKMLLSAGGPQFKRDLQRRLPPIRECLHFRGDPHPTMGDLPSKMVRECAQEVINAIFETEVLAPSDPSAFNTPAAPVAAPAASAHAVPVAAPAASSGGAAPAPAPAFSGKYGGFGSDQFSGGGGAGAHRSIDSYFSAGAAPPAPGAAPPLRPDGRVAAALVDAGNKMSAQVQESFAKVAAPAPAAAPAAGPAAGPARAGRCAAGAGR